jgi:indole-3-glycerol phosphate synthase
LLDPAALGAFIKIAEELKLSALVEIHDEGELEKALGAGARIIGINNRNLKTFAVDLALTAHLRPLVPAGIVTVAESGIASPADVRALQALAIDAALVGESLMRSPDKKRFLAELRAGVAMQTG